ncbi:hypothetical protein [Noviherbaspirillum sedimenti]|nr:hypothetical protein [Noviherbaspirillum sedimenti]
MNPTDRKQALVAQAALHRQRMAQAGQAVSAGLHAGALVKGAGGLALAGLALLRSKKGGGAGAGGMAALLPLAAPLAMRGLSFLGRIKPSGPTVRKLLTVAALGALAAFAVKRATATKARRIGKRN